MAMSFINNLKVRNKKGQSLVEVMVAMFVLMIVFVTSVTLIVQSLNLVMMSRSRTEVAAIAQRAMTELVLQIKSSCPAFSGTLSPLTFEAPANKVGNYTVVKAATLVTQANLPTSAIYTFQTSGTYEVTVTLTWRDRGAPTDSTYVLKQLVTAQ